MSVHNSLPLTRLSTHSGTVAIGARYIEPEFRIARMGGDRYKYAQEVTKGELARINKKKIKKREWMERNVWFVVQRN